MADSQDKLTDEQLKARWETPEGQAFRDEIIRQLQSEETGHAVDWENLKVVVGGMAKLWRDFPGVEANHINRWLYESKDFVKAIEKMLKNAISLNTNWGDLRFIKLKNIDISETSLSGANIDNANLLVVNLNNTDLSMTSLKNATLFSCNLQNVSLYSAQLENAELSHSDLENASLVFAHLESTDFTKAYLQNADLNNATFRLKSFWWRMGLFRLLEKPGMDISRFRPTLLNGADLTGIKLGSSPTMHRKLLDEVYLEDFAEHHPVYYQLWLWTSNCGRSPLLVGFWALLIGVFFGAVFAHYTYWGPDWGWLQSIFVIDKPMFVFDGPEWWRPYYHSFTTLTTLGWASVNPNSEAGFWWHTGENITGYVMLGYLIAVIGDLLTRRSN